MVKEKRIEQLVGLLGVVIILLKMLAFIWWFWETDSAEQPRSIVKSYRECVGIAFEGQEIYDELVGQFGEPDSVEFVEPYGGDSRYFIYVTFDKLSFRFSAEPEELEDRSSWSLGSITTRDPEHYFTKDKVHVGSTREEVLHAYRRSTSIYSQPNYDSITDGYSFDEKVYYVYDSNDIVISIEFGYAM